MDGTIPGARIQLSDVNPQQLAALSRLTASIELARGLRELVNVRASQVNGCAFCIDKHWRDARAGGESEARLYMLDAWRESTLYSKRERAALELCEAVTLVADGHVPDDVWQRASEAFDDHELGQVVLATTTINAWNRLMTAARAKPGTVGELAISAARANDE